MEDVSADQVTGLSPGEAQLFRIRHSLAHVLAQAVLSFYPKARLAFGPPVENGFYYDFDFGAETVTDVDLPRIEAKMREIIKARQPFAQEEMPVPAAEELLRSMDQPYKVEHAALLGSKGTGELSFYRNGPFVDMCEG